MDRRCHCLLHLEEKRENKGKKNGNKKKKKDNKVSKRKKIKEQQNKRLMDGRKLDFYNSNQLVHLVHRVHS